TYHDSRPGLVKVLTTARLWESFVDSGELLQVIARGVADLAALRMELERRVFWDLDSIPVGNLKAFCSIAIGGLKIHDLKIVQQEGKEAWVALPSARFE